MKQIMNGIINSISNYSLILRLIICNLVLISIFLFLLICIQDFFIAEDLNCLESYSIQNLHEPVKEIVGESDKVNFPSHQQESILTDKTCDSQESKPFYKNPYCIGAVIAILSVIAVTLCYSLSPEDISDTDSIASSTTIVSDVSSTPTLVNPIIYRYIFPEHQLTELIIYCDTAIRYFGQYELTDIAPLLGNYLTIDSMFIHLFRSKLEENDLEFFNFLSLHLGYSPLNVFHNPAYIELFINFWIPSDLYPTYQSFVNDFTIKYTEYLNLSID